MSELSNSLGGSGPKHSIESNGKVYPVSLVTQGVKIAYEKALFRMAREGLSEIKSAVDKDYYERKMDALVAKYEDGDFAMESDYGRKTLSRPGGSLLLLSILMGTKGPDGDITPMPQFDVMNIISQKPEEAAAVFKTVIIESFPGVDVASLSTTAALEGDQSPKVQNPTPLPSG